MRMRWRPAAAGEADPLGPDAPDDELAFSAEEALAMDRWLIEERGFTLEALMQQAGARLAEAVRELRAAWGCARVVFLAGPGNNGGDAVVAREQLGGAAAGALWRPLDGEPAPALAHDDLLVDGLFGVGLARPVTGAAAAALTHVAESGAQVLAVDVPSGLDATSGRVLGVALPARATLCFVGPKAGFFIHDGPAHVGEWCAAPIGFDPREVFDWVRARRASSG